MQRAAWMEGQADVFMGRKKERSNSREPDYRLHQKAQRLVHMKQASVMNAEALDRVEEQNTEAVTY
jgi:hypothetical protein